MRPYPGNLVIVQALRLLILKYIIKLWWKSAGKIRLRASKSRPQDIRPLDVILVDLK